jgi:hypothetical protein
VAVVAYLKILWAHSLVDSFAVNLVDTRTGYLPNTWLNHHRCSVILSYLLLCNPQVHRRVHKILTADPMTSQLNPIYFTQCSSLNISAWSSVFLEKLTVAQLIKKFTGFYAFRMVIAVFTRVCRVFEMSHNTTAFVCWVVRLISRLPSWGKDIHRSLAHARLVYLQLPSISGGQALKTRYIVLIKIHLTRYSTDVCFNITNRKTRWN